uniref:Uncharacterized protein n=1 Tax=Anopheles culicifacies TaxID=139723 RepID=A0A182LRC1_9DIPT
MLVANVASLRVVPQRFWTTASHSTTGQGAETHNAWALALLAGTSGVSGCNNFVLSCGVSSCIRGISVKLQRRGSGQGETKISDFKTAINAPPSIVEMPHTAGVDRVADNFARYGYAKVVDLQPNQPVVAAIHSHVSVHFSTVLSVSRESA